VYDTVRSGKLVQLFPSPPASRNHREPAIYVVRLPGRSHAKKAQLFISHLKTHIGDTPYWDRG
jgi:DNA-binding transcriptional LysR family regulator